MIRVVFTRNMERHVKCPPVSLDSRGVSSVREALARVFASNPAAETYVLDDQGALRQHMIVYVNGRAIADRRMLGDSLSDGDEIYVMQALSGG